MKVSGEFDEIWKKQFSWKTTSRGQSPGPERGGGGGCHSPSLSEEIEGFLFNRLVKRLFSLRASSHVKGIANLYFWGAKQMKSVCDSVCSLRTADAFPVVACLQCVRCHARKARQIKCLLTEGKDNDYVSDSVLYSTDQSSRVHFLALT